MNKKIRKVLVTGGAGFLGSHIVRSLISVGIDVISAKRTDSNIWRLERIRNKITSVDMDIFDQLSIQKTISTYRPNAVIHCAAYGVDYREQNARLAVATNIIGSYDLLEASAKHNVLRFIHIGSCFEYGDKGCPVRENDSLEPTSIYGSTKAAASLLLLRAANELGVELVILRPFGLWGQMEAIHRLVPQIINASLNKKKLNLTACQQVRDYSYAADIANIITAIALHEKFPACDVVNVGRGEPVVLRDFVLAVARELNGEDFMNFGALPYRPTEIMYLVADISRQRSLISDFYPTLLSEGVKQIVSDLKIVD